MLSYIELAFAWLLFISMPLVAAGMFYRARKFHAMRKPGHAASLAPAGDAAEHLQRYSVLINLAGGVALCAVVVCILLFGLSFAVWSGMAALIIWSYFVASMMLDRRRARLGAS